MSPRLPRVLHGKIIYATPGSGKTYLCSKYSNAIDSDDVFVNIAENITNFRPNYDLNDPRHNIRDFMKYINFNKRIRDQIYSAMAEEFNELAECGNVVLTGSIDLMYMADIILIQNNEGIIRNNFNSNRELSELDSIDLNEKQVLYIHDYLEQLGMLMNFTDL